MRSNQLSYEPNSTADFQLQIENQRSPVITIHLKKSNKKTAAQTASGFQGPAVMPYGSLKQKLTSNQDFLQNPNPAPFRRLQNCTIGTYV